MHLTVLLLSNKYDLLIQDSEFAMKMLSYDMAIIIELLVYEYCREIHEYYRLIYSTAPLLGFNPHELSNVLR